MHQFFFSLYFAYLRLDIVWHIDGLLYYEVFQGPENLACAITIDIIAHRRDARGLIYLYLTP